MSKTVLVTGASTGIGRATAFLLAREGFTVYAGVRKDADGEALGSTVTPIKLDVTDAGQIADAAERLGHLDALVNNAGIGVTGPVEFVPLDALRRQYEVNVFGQVAVTQAMLPMLRASRGRVVTVGSVGGWITLPFGGPLCSSKHAIRSINDAMRMELKPYGVAAVLIEPGSIHTDAVDKLEDEVEPRRPARPDRAQATRPLPGRQEVTADEHARPHRPPVHPRRPATACAGPVLKRSTP
ncbi:SDR family oxidoreductase [Nonomuraea insulae]|uniref:SDR family oxidoreductase n=1 Tax=Nonomuraea insulae TaxID=1616787 RepID=A0ABW1CP11_9ACTN